MFIVEEESHYTDYGNHRKIRKHRFVYGTQEEVDEHLSYVDRPGFGQELDRVLCHVYSIEPVLIRSQERPPITMLDKALALHAYDHRGCTRLGGKIKVDVGLRGRGGDGPCVFWDSRGNSFAIVQPPENCPQGLVSEQGVLLLSINGIGEIRWDVNRSCSRSPENIEAVDHFGLTWT